jgi:hypothetical protein
VNETPVFEYTGTFEIKGRGTAYIGPAPFDFSDDTNGKVVLVDGVERTIRSFERGHRAPRKGEITSLLFADEKPPANT